MTILSVGDNAYWYNLSGFVKYVGRCSPTYICGLKNFHYNKGRKEGKEIKHSFCKFRKKDNYKKTKKEEIIKLKVTINF